MIDAHAHLYDPRFAGDLADVLERARTAGVDRVLSCGEDVASCEANLAIARRHAMVRVAAGVHPHRAASWDADAQRRVAELARDRRAVAVGEIGMDLSGRSAPRADQERAFLAQLRLAADLDLPVVVHVRDAGGVARDIVDRVPGSRGMIHCFSEGEDEVREWVARGFAVSFAGTVTYPSSAGLRDAARRVPADAVLVETDAPYLAPRSRRGKRNEPAFVVETLRTVAEALGTPDDVLARRVSENARRLFGVRWE